MKLALEFLFVALLARSGRSKNNFLQFLVFLVDISVELQNKESYNRRGDLKLWESNRHNFSRKPTELVKNHKKFFFWSGNFGAYFKRVFS